jgi:glutamate-1-semialdehyde 2,1-aminomutase
LKAKTERLVGSIVAHAQAKGYKFNMFNVGSIFWVSFSEKKSVRRMDEIDENGMKKFAPLHLALLERGVYLGPSGYEVGFVSAAHTEADIDYAIKAFCDSLDELSW